MKGPAMAENSYAFKFAYWLPPFSCAKAARLWASVLSLAGPVLTFQHVSLDKNCHRMVGKAKVKVILLFKPSMGGMVRICHLLLVGSKKLDCPISDRQWQGLQDSSTVCPPWLTFQNAIFHLLLFEQLHYLFAHTQSSSSRSPVTHQVFCTVSLGRVVTFQKKMIYLNPNFH